MKSVKIRKIVNPIEGGIIIQKLGDVLNKEFYRVLKNNETGGITWGASISCGIISVGVEKDVWVTPNESTKETGYMTIPLNDALHLDPSRIEIYI
jgi:hypothetical protein